MKGPECAPFNWPCMCLVLIVPLCPHSAFRDLMTSQLVLFKNIYELAGTQIVQSDAFNGSVKWWYGSLNASIWLHVPRVYNTVLNAYAMPWNFKNRVLVHSLTLQIYYVYSNVFYMYFELTFLNHPKFVKIGISLMYNLYWSWP